MKSMAVAAMMMQLMAAGGAGSQGERATGRDAAAADVGKDIAALKHELSSLSAEFSAARERRRLEAEQKRRENEEWHLGPKAPAAPAQPGTSASSRGAGASTR